MGCLLNEQVQTYVFKIPEIIYKSCFRRKDLPMEKITCHSWHHLAMEDAFLGRLGLFESVSADGKDFSNTPWPIVARIIHNVSFCIFNIIVSSSLEYFSLVLNTIPRKTM